KLTGEPWDRLNVTLQGRYKDVMGTESKFGLPHVENIAAGSTTEIYAEVPEDIELIAPEQPGPGLLTPQGPHKQVWRPDARNAEAERPPESVELSWRPYRQEVRVRSVADLTLLPSEGHVRQQLHFRVPPGASMLRQVTLRLPPELKSARFQVVDGG